ncbi:metallophosphoesterase [Marinobacterium sediminicola]|uniref:Calcineurin-like phosphoesterase n=1 Tax=Marinobacterium sediminicola TaxID=518898 RepID=A0ABY1S203_9GAMM|nr:metallophosphoesterase [Marinobacterium sediminicola]ULG68550.1 metallophosphoesterase [Marinobacterium sediminicola]SMR76581.1 Calcineurin-like phosphoesterase [Marinobacterium sediminicola]
MSEQYDLVGDIHGHASALEPLLRAMGYQPKGKGYTHPERTLVMVGDLIDRGPEQARVLEIVRAMVDSGDALVVMGNHEFNAICYATLNESGGYVRPHIYKNTYQHRAFLKAFPFGSRRHEEAIAFYKQLPLWLELEALQVVHACWHLPSMKSLLPWLDDKNRIRDERFYQHYALKDEPLYSAVECVLKGPEVDLPAGAEFTDKDGIVRREARINWWQLHKGESASLAVRPELHDEHDLSVQYEQARVFEYRGETLTFFGHYWQRDFDPEGVRGQRAFCLDYSVAKQGQLVAARWNGQRENIEWFAIHQSERGSC